MTPRWGKQDGSLVISEGLVPRRMRAADVVTKERVIPALCSAGRTLIPGSGDGGSTPRGHQGLPGFSAPFGPRWEPSAQYLGSPPHILVWSRRGTCCALQVLTAAHELPRTSLEVALRALSPYPSRGPFAGRPLSLPSPHPISGCYLLFPQDGR